MIIEQTFLLSFLMLTVTSIEGLYSYFAGAPEVFSWFVPLTLLFMSFLCSLPTLLLMTEKNLTKLQWRMRIAFHCVLLYALVMGGGYLFRWYTNLTYFIVTSVAYFVIYCLVWSFSIFLTKYDEKLINDALAVVRDEE